MQSTIQDIDQTTTAAAVEENRLAKRLRNAMLLAMARRNTRRVVEGLSEAQLKDSGIDRVPVLGNRPVFDVEARLATYLASLR
jgi:uncharacterized protein YjiS (DUF1127 family)